MKSVWIENIAFAVAAIALLMAFDAPDEWRDQPSALAEAGGNRVATPRDNMAAPLAEPAPVKMSFGDYPCNGSCDVHQAGYAWAEENGIIDPDNCTGDSGRFIEGCRVYAMQRRALANYDSH